MENTMKFHETLTVEQFKDKMQVDKILVRRNPKTNKLFCTYGVERGMVAANGVPEHPMMSHVSGISRETNEPFDCWLLHEEGIGAPIEAEF